MDKLVKNLFLYVRFEEREFFLISTVLEWATQIDSQTNLYLFTALRYSNLLSNFCLVACGSSQTLFIMPSVNKTLDQKHKLTSKPFWLLNHDWLHAVHIFWCLFDSKLLCD